MANCGAGKRDTGECRYMSTKESDLGGRAQIQKCYALPLKIKAPLTH